ncbi:MAG: ABC transporter ATP-binding protein [Mucinivorans sp.]
MLEINALSLGYKDGPPLVVDINAKGHGGELIALVGRNGSGKSTLLRSLAGLVRPRAGQILVDGEDIFAMSSSARARKVAYVSTEAVRVAHLRVWDVVAMGRAPYMGWSGALSPGDTKAVEQALDQVQMSSFAKVPLMRLSDGERQRVMVARAMAQETPMVLLDEPTAFLDLPNRMSTTKLLYHLAHKTGKMILFSTHELHLAMELSDLLWIIAQGVLHTGTPHSFEGSEALDKVMNG